MLTGAQTGSTLAFRSNHKLPADPARAGFTLIEILTVISIIALLSSMILVAIQKARVGANDAVASTEIGTLVQALEQYVQDESEYPGASKKISAETNHFPDLFNALFGERKPNGPGGRNAPYMTMKEEKLVVYNDETEAYERATKEQIDNFRIPKYVADPWGNPYVYRANKGRKKEDFMRNPYGADIYSLGPNGIDDTAEGNDESDDIGNW